MVIAQKRQRAIEGTQDQIEQAELDNDKTPEGEKVGNTGKRITQHTSLAQHHQEEITDALIDVVVALLLAGLYQQRDQLTNAKAEEDERGQEYDDKDRCADPSPGRRDCRGRHNAKPPSRSWTARLLSWQAIMCISSSPALDNRSPLSAGHPKQAPFRVATIPCGCRGQ